MTYTTRPDKTTKTPSRFGTFGITKTALTFCVAAAVLGLSSCSDTVTVRSTDGGPQNGITVSATGEAKVVPDAVRMNLTVSAVAQDTESALNEASGSAELIRGELEKGGVMDKDIATQNISVNPEYSYTNGGQELIGYRATQGFDILIEDAENAGEVIDAVVRAGGRNVSVNGTYPVVVDTEKSLTEARKDAIEKARAKAQEYADLLGVELGQVLYVSESTGQYAVPVMGRAGGAVAEKNDTVVDLGTQNVSVSVEIRWELR